MKRLATTSDSLDLLLGPMCNTFGILVFVACITALFAQQSGDKTAAGVGPAQELLQRRLNVAEDDRHKLQALVGDSPEPLTVDRARMLLELDQLRQALEVLRDQSQVLDKKISLAAGAAAVDPGLNLHELKEQQRALQREAEALRNTLPAMDQQIAELDRRTRNLEDDKAKVVETRTVRMRFPREHVSDLQPFPVIFKYGRIYPLGMANGSSNPDLVRTQVDADGSQYDPVPYKGWTLDANKDEILELAQAMKGNHMYFSLYAYPDSFDVCRRFKQVLVDESLQFGLRPVMEKQKLVFGSKGGSPPPL